MPEPLAACPFCGSRAIEVWESPVGGPFAMAACRDCHAYGPEGQSIDEATTAWNTRLPAPEVNDA